MHRFWFALLSLVVLLLVPRLAFAWNCGYDVSEDIGGDLTQPTGAWQTANSSCSTSGCRAYFDIQVVTGDVIEISL